MSEATWTIGHLDELSSPWGNAGGVIKTVEELEKMIKTGVGWAEAGSYCAEPRYGNQKNPDGTLKISETTELPICVDAYNPLTGEGHNSLGMPGQGIDALEEDIPEMRQLAEAHDKKLIINVAPVSDDPVAEARELVWRAFEAGAHGVLVNGGCPNVLVEGNDDEAARHELLSRDYRMTFMVLTGLRDVVEKYHKVFFRSSPQLSYDKAMLVYRNIERAGTVSAVWVPNTWPGQKPLDENGRPILEVPGNIGGKSGPAMADRAAEQVKWAVDIFNGSGIKVVGSSGIKDAPEIGRVAAVELKRQMDLGAVAASGTSFYYWPEHGWQEDTDRLLTQFAALNS